MYSYSKISCFFNCPLQFRYKYIDKVKVEQSLDFAEGRMKKKVLGASEALQLGVSKVVFADGRINAPIQGALAGKGTVIS